MSGFWLLRAWESCPFFGLGRGLFIGGADALWRIDRPIGDSDFYLLASRAGACGPGDYRYGRHCNKRARHLSPYWSGSSAEYKTQPAIRLGSGERGVVEILRVGVFAGCSFGIGDFMDAGRGA